MPRYQRYLLRQLIGPFVLVTLGLTAVVWLSQSLRIVDLIVNKGLSFSAFLLMSMLVLPTFLSAILPIAFFSALLFVYNKLTIDSELVSLRAAGVSQWSLAKPALAMATIVVVISYAIIMYVMPVSHREFKERQFVLRSDHSALLLEEGTFNTLTEGVTVYIRGREGGTLNGILVHDAREQERPVTMMAEQGNLVQTAEGPRFILINGHRQRLDRDSSKLSLLNFERYTMDLGDFVQRGGERWRGPRERFIDELLDPASEGAERLRGKFLSEAHNRIVSPLFGYALAAIGLAALLSGNVDRRGQWRRILVAIAAGVMLEAVALFLVNATAKNSSLIPLMYLNPVLVIAAAMVVMRRRWPRFLGGRTAAAEPGARG
ncbi:MAG: LPS export ABC transporter permease LptF [Rhodospirillales bacterium]|nr:LPS export ABC transporter permease LptF [Rhodospirillales bacterium]